MKTSRRGFLGALAAFAFGVQAEVFGLKATIRPPKAKGVIASEDIVVGQPLYASADGKIRPYPDSRNLCIGIAIGPDEMFFDGGDKARISTTRYWTNEA